MSKAAAEVVTILEDLIRNCDKVIVERKFGRVEVTVFHPDTHSHYDGPSVISAVHRARAGEEKKR